MRVMIVDDFLEDRFFLNHMLSTQLDDVKIDEFSFAEDALDHLSKDETETYEYIFVDINMLRMDGFAFASAYQDRFSQSKGPAKIFLVSGSFDTGDFTRGSEHPGVFGVLKKPVTAEGIQQALAT